MHLQIQVHFNGVVGTFMPGTGSYGHYGTQTFTVPAGSHTITLAGLGTSGYDTTFVDNVQLIVSPGTPTAPQVVDSSFESVGQGSGSNAYTYNPPSAAPAAETETSTYNALGDRTSFTDRNGTTHAYRYDALDRLTVDTVSNFGTGVDQTVATLGLAFNDEGLLASATSYGTSGNVVNQDAYTYDGLGNVASEVQEVAESSTAARRAWGIRTIKAMAGSRR